MSSNILGPEWNLSAEGLNVVTQNGAIKDGKTVLKHALDSDLKIIGKPALASELSKSRLEKIVLQIQKIRNISAPKAKEESQAAPRMLKLTLTDGDSYIQAIEMSPINSISREKTAPGTKLLINGASISLGYLLINPQNCTVLGGQVEHLYEKWLLAKSIQQNHQYGKVSNEGAPPWVAFGGKIISGNQDKPFKSLEKGKDGNNDSEFEQQRKDAIAEASSGAVRKTFGGRVKQTVQPVQSNNQFNRGGRNNERDHDRGGRRGKFTQREDEGVEKLQRPSEKVSLFSFLEDKLPLPEPKKPLDYKSQSGSSYTKPANQNYQKDTRSQQKNEGNYTRNDGKATSKPQFEKNNTYQKNDRANNQQNNYNTYPKIEKYNNQQSYNSIAPTLKHSNSVAMSSTSSKNLPQKSNSGDASSPKFSSSGISSSNSIRKNEESLGNNVNNYNARGSQDNQYRNTSDRYLQQNASGYSKDNFGEPQNSGNARQQQRWEGNDRTNSFGGPQYHNPNNYQPPNTQYNQKSQPNAAPSPSQNAEMHHLANNLSKMSVSNEFASRSLRQHLNLGPPKRHDAQGVQGTGPNTLSVGDQCMARYWEDGKFYQATVAAITDKTYAVQFTGYGNIEEVLKHECFSSANSYNQQRNPNYSYPPNNFPGTTMEFRSRRGPPRPRN